MGRRWNRAGTRAGRVGVLAVVAALAACGPRAGEPPGTPGQLRISFEDRPQPGVFLLEAPAVRDKPKGAAGLWAAVAGLKRPERAEAVNLASGAAVEVALYAAGRSGPPLRLSNEAADALGIGAVPVKVRVTALRQRPVVDTTNGGF